MAQQLSRLWFNLLDVTNYEAVDVDEIVWLT